MDAAEMIRGENPEISAGLRQLAEQHQENLPNYLEAEGYDNILKTFHKVLDFFEDELGRDGRSGRWLGGSMVSIADITLGELFILEGRVSKRQKKVRDPHFGLQKKSGFHIS